jgi:hypothetical protein
METLTQHGSFVVSAGRIGLQMNPLDDGTDGRLVADSTCKSRRTSTRRVGKGRDGTR